MKNMYQPASWIFYILCIFIFFFIGASVASISGLAEEHGMSGGAMVLMVGAMCGLVAWFIALYLAYKFDRKTISNLNKLLLVIALAIVFYYAYKTNMLTPNKETTSIQTTTTPSVIE